MSFKRKRPHLILSFIIIVADRWLIAADWYWNNEYQSSAGDLDSKKELGFFDCLRQEISSCSFFSTKHSGRMSSISQRIRDDYSVGRVGSNKNLPALIGTPDLFFVHMQKCSGTTTNVTTPLTSYNYSFFWCGYECLCFVYDIEATPLVF